MPGMMNSRRRTTAKQPFAFDSTIGLPAYPHFVQTCVGRRATASRSRAATLATKSRASIRAAIERMLSFQFVTGHLAFIDSEVDRC